MPQLFARPRTPNDNPFIESMFSTVKTDPEFPDRFQDDVQAEAYFGVYVPWYNTEHYHSGIDYVTPHQAHTGQRAAIVEERQRQHPRTASQTPGGESAENGVDRTPRKEHKPTQVRRHSVV